GGLDPRLSSNQPPHHGSMECYLETMRRHNYRCALCSVYPYDPHHAWTRFSTAFVLRNARPGSVIVLHDGGARGQRTAAVLEAVLPALARRGLGVVTLSELVSSTDQGP